jgi:hypothetical protein
MDRRGNAAVVALARAGVVSVIGMLVESRRRNGHPWHWFTGVEYGIKSHPPDGR